ncbi:MAG TPA: hypothetical protein VK116_09155 [Planctomycetota bacterium]|nr:hypothetical protein [Planctomycetota bacterium]
MLAQIDTRDREASEGPSDRPFGALVIDELERWKRWNTPTIFRYAELHKLDHADREETARVLRRFGRKVVDAARHESPDEVAYRICVRGDALALGAVISSWSVCAFAFGSFLAGPDLVSITPLIGLVAFAAVMPFLGFFWARTWIRNRDAILWRQSDRRSVHPAPPRSRSGSAFHDR